MVAIDNESINEDLDHNDQDKSDTDKREGAILALKS